MKHLSLSLVLLLLPGTALAAKPKKAAPTAKKTAPAKKEKVEAKAPVKQEAEPEVQPTPEPAATPEPAVAIPLAPAVSTRPDGLIFIHEVVPGPAVSVRLLLRLDGPSSPHPAPSAAPVTALAALHAGPHGRRLASGGAARVVEVQGSNLVIGVDTVRERWVDDLTSFLSALSNPGLSPEALRTARVQATASAPPNTALELAKADHGTRQERDPSITLTNGLVPSEVTLDGAVWHVEESWSANRMVLVVAGDIPAQQVQDLVDRNFLVPADPLRKTPATVALSPVNEAPNAQHGHILFGQWARGLPPEEMLVVAAHLENLLQAERPAAGECNAFYQPHPLEPAVMTVCANTRGQALDVKQFLTQTWAPETAAAPTASQWAAARQRALASLVASRQSAPATATRLATWAAAGFKGGAELEQAVKTTQDARLQASFTALLEPSRAIRKLCTSKAE